MIAESFSSKRHLSGRQWGFVSKSLARMKVTLGRSYVVDTVPFHWPRNQFVESDEGTRKLKVANDC
jgi:hypothetical protein